MAGYGPSGFAQNTASANYLSGRQAADQEHQANQLSRARDQSYQQDQTAANDQQQQKAAQQLYLASQYALQAPAGQTKAFVEQNFPDLVTHAGAKWATATEDDVRAELKGAAAHYGSQAGIAPTQPKERPLINTIGPDGKPVRGEDKVGAAVYEAPKEDTGPLESIIGPNGKPVLATRKNAVGQAPYVKPQAAQTYDQNSVENTAQMIANNQIPMISGFALKSPWGQEVISRVRELNPNYAGADYGSNAAGLKQFTSGKNGNTIRSLNVAVQHLDQLSTLADALDSGDVPLFNKVAVAYKQQTGNAAPSNFNAAKKVVADEIVKAIVGSGGGVADREEAANSINAAQSPAQLKGVIQTYQGLMTGQLNGIREQYKSATGRDNFETLLLPETRAKLEAHSAQPTQQAPAQQQGQRLTPEQAMKLPPGTSFVGMDGVSRVRH